MPDLYFNFKVYLKPGPASVSVLDELREFMTGRYGRVDGPMEDGSFIAMLDTENLDYEQVEWLKDDFFDRLAKVSAKPFRVTWSERDDDYTDEDDRWYGHGCEVAEADYLLDKNAASWIIETASAQGLDNLISKLTEAKRRRFIANGFTD